VKKHLDAWYAEVDKASWKDPAELKAQFRSASVVSGERVVFNIKGNDYRLIVAINYHYQILLIIWLGTHKEYDKVDAKGVAYEKERYADSSNSNLSRSRFCGCPDRRTDWSGARYGER